MAGTLRALVVAIAIAASLLGSASVASADPGPPSIDDPSDITWE